MGTDRERRLDGACVSRVRCFRHLLCDNLRPLTPPPPLVPLHSDRYERLLRQKTLTKGSDGVAVIEYEDGEREMVDMKMEKFRSCQDSDDEDDRDDDTVNGDSDINDLRLIVEGEWIEILWKNASIYFPCKIISWTPISAKKSQQRKENSKKRAFDDDESKKPTKPKLSQPKEQPKEHMKVSTKPKSTKRVFEDVKESAETKPKSTKRVFDDAKEPTKPNSAQIKQRQTDPPPLSTKQGHEVTTSRGKRQPKNAEPELPLFPPLLPPFQNGLDNHFYSSNSSEISTDDESDQPVDRDGHGIPLYNEPEGDFDSSDDDVSDDDDNDDDDGEGTYQHRCLSEVRPKLSFEELWTLKLKRTQELMYRGGSQSNGIS